MVTFDLDHREVSIHNYIQPYIQPIYKNKTN